MKKSIVAALLLASSATLAFAQTTKPDDNSISGKEMKDSPGVQGGGKTDMPKAKPDDGSLQGKAMKDAPGVTAGGRTDMPRAKPDDGSLQGKEMTDAPGVK
jgi:hypothetical protein